MLFLKKAKHHLVFGILRPLINRLLISITPQHQYLIKPNYTPNLLPRTYRDSLEYSHLYQTQVYQLAAKLIDKHNLKSVVDVGCGHGYKLNKYISPKTLDITGIDHPQSISYCTKTYKFGTFVSDNIEKPYNKPTRKFDLILSVDVIEHLFRPELLIDYLKSLAHNDSYIVISTPDRDLVRGPDDLGPPANLAHVREWNKTELAKFIKSQKLRIKEHTHLSDIDSTKIRSSKKRTFGKTCQVIVAALSK